MLIEFQRPHASIDRFDPTEIADFTVLTGVNGSGKSHLLEAIDLRHVTIRGLENAHIVLFNYENFRLENEPSFTGHQLSAEREGAWQFHQQNMKNNVESWKGQLGTNYPEIIEQAKSQNTSLWAVGGTLIKQYKDQFKNFMKSNNFLANEQAQGVYTLAKNLQYSIDEISHEDFIQKYKPFVFRKDFLPTQLGKVFWDYYIKYRSNQVNQFENEKNGKNYLALTEKEFIAQHGEKPWVIANKILEEFDTLTYELVSPEGNDFFGSYKLELRHTKKPDLKVEFASLSSGERILMALVASIYKASSDRNFPDVLLLDEVDASLHPSMMKNMLNVITNIFLAQGIKVILVTHSPTTIALSQEDSVFVMNPSGESRIEKRTQKEALSILTQGYATIDEGLKFFDEVAKSNTTIITEGYNTKFIAKALELFEITGVEVLEGIEHASGKHQLKTLFEFFSRMSHKNKIIFVFDCDVSYCLKEEGFTYPFTFERNLENTIASKGVENLFDPSLFEGFKTTITNPNEHETVKFHEPSKRNFETFILKRESLEDFKKFKPLIDEIKRIRDFQSAFQKPQLDTPQNNV